jgi:O-antigen/teichoic acid export membrane protein
LGLLFGQAFTAGYLPMVILIGGHVVAALLGAFNGLLNMTGNEAAGARAIAVGAFVNLVLNIALIPVYGMVGAATATLISALVWHGMLSWGIRKHVGIRPTVFGI